MLPTNYVTCVFPKKNDLLNNFLFLNIY